MKRQLHKQVINLSLFFAVCLLPCVPLSAQWLQRGLDIGGEADYDQSGSSVSFSSDGTTVAIGAPFSAGGGNNSGHVRIYQRVSGTWTQLGADIDGEADNDNSGTSVSLSSDGTTVAIGAPKNDGNGNNAGHVRVYQLVSGTWTQIGADIDGEVQDDESGTSVSLSSDGTTVAIGAPKNDGNGNNAGHVRVYQLVSGIWTQLGADMDGEANSRSGGSVSLSSDGTMVAIGASFNAGGGSYRGHVRVYQLVSGTWTQLGADMDGEGDNDFSGSSVSLSSDGTTVAIGASGNAGGGSYRGHVRVYQLMSGTWTQLGADIDGEANNDTSGSSVSLSSDGTTVAIGAPNSNTYRGHVRVYQLVSGTWTQLGTDIVGEADYDNSGISVSLSSDGTTVAIGAPYNAGGGNYRGHVRVYNLELCINPTPYALTGGGAYCSGGAGVTVGLSNSESGVTYQLKNGATDVGTPVDGTGSAISFGNQTAAATYTVVATRTSGGCTASMTGNAVTSVILLPTAYAVTGGGAYCTGASGVAVGLANSESGVTYQLKNGATDIGSPVDGTGSAISFGNQTTAATYTVVATRTTGGCTAEMTNSVTVTVASPSATISGNTSFCTGSSTTLSVPAQSGATYCWASSTATPAWKNVGSAGFSTGSPFTISLAFSGSTPYVAYSDGGNGIKATVKKYNGSAWETVGSAGFSAGFANYTSFAFSGSTPYVAYSDGANGNKATVMKYNGSAWETVGSAGFSAGTIQNTSLAFNGSTPYVAYTDVANGDKATVMKYNGSAWETVGSAGFSAGFADYTSLAFSGSTPYVAYSDGANGDKATVMKYNGSAWETVGSAGFSAGDADYTSLAFSGSTPYLAYGDGANDFKATVMKYNGSAWETVGSAGFSAADAGYPSIAFSGSTPYLAYGDGANDFKATVMKYNGSAWETVGSASFSAGGAYFTSIAFDGSTPYVAYQDYGNGGKATVMKFESCLGSSNSFAVNTAGTYTVTVNVNGCTASASQSVTVNAAPTAFAVTGGGAYCTGASGVAVGLANSESGVTYQLKNGATDIGSPVDGTGSAISFGNQTAAGTYTVVATRTTGGCTAEMTNSVTVTVTTSPSATISGAPSFCAGGSTTLSVPAQSGATYCWTTPAWETVGSAGFSAGQANYPSLAFDGSTPYVAYSDDGNDNKATVMKYNGSAWETVGSAGFSAGRIQNPSLAFSGSTPYVAYRDGGNGNKATVMRYNGSAWETVGSAGFSAGDANNTSLAFSGSTPYVAYTDGANGYGATVMRYNGSAWETVGSAGFSAGQANFTSLAFSGSTPYVAYNDGGNGYGATVMKYNGSAWETVGSAGFSAGQANFTSLAFSGSTPYVAFQDYGNGYGATVMRYNGSAWETVGSAGFSAGQANFTSLAFSGSTPYVAYANGYVATVMKYNGSAWETLDNAGFSAGQAHFTSLAFSSSTPYVAFQDAANGGKATVMKFESCLGSSNSFAVSTAGTYTVTVNINGCTASASQSVTVNAAPTAFAITGGGAYCSGTNGVEVGLSNSEIGVTYQLKKDNVDDGTPVDGTGSTISFGNITAVGTYTVVATNTSSGCTAEMTNNAMVSVNALPSAYAVTGGGAYCSGGAGVTVDLENSESSVTYQLKNGATDVGTPVDGTDSAISFGNQTAAGTYTVVATNTNGGCSTEMTNSVTVTINPPMAFAVTGGGAYCSGGSGLAVGLENSESGISYQLKINDIDEGAPVTGTGNAISFGNQTAAGTYTVVATNTNGGCSTAMTNNAMVSVNALPSAFAVTGGGVFCSGGSGVAVGLENSESGISYQLKINDIDEGAPVTGTGNAISFGNQTAAGTYTVVATNTNGGCSTEMTNNAMVSVNALPSAYDVTGGGAYCSGGAGVTVDLENSESGVTYQLKNGATDVGSPVDGTGSAISFGNQTAAGTYTVVATITSSGCTAEMTNNVTVTVNAPTAYNVTGGGLIQGGTPIAITLSNSDLNVNYQLLKDGADYGVSVAGTGNALVFSTNQVGIYTVVATSSNGCTALMSGSALVEIRYCVTSEDGLTRISLSYTPASNSYDGTNYESLYFVSWQTPSYWIFRRNYDFFYSNNSTGATPPIGQWEFDTNSGGSPLLGNTITVNEGLCPCSPPTPYNVTGGGAYCSGGAGVTVDLENSESGVSYQLKNGATDVGTPVDGTGSAISFGNQTTAATYTVVATRTTGGCTAEMTNSVTVTVATSPSATISGNTSFCTGSSTTLSVPAQSGATYCWASSTATPTWENVGSAGFSAGFANYTSLAFDGSTPYVAYQDFANDNKATVMKYNGSAWETVGSAGFSAGEAKYTSFAFSGSTPYVAYQDVGNGNKATVMRYNGSAWETVGSAGFSAGFAYFTSLAFEGSTPYVAYQDIGNGYGATVMRYNGSAWETVGSAGFSAGGAGYTSLAFNGSTPYVAYTDDGNSGKATVMRYNGSTWETVGSAGFSAGEAYGIRIAFSGSTPYVAYADDANGGKATVMRYNGSAWENVGSAGFSAGEAGYTSFAFSGSTPYVAYTDGGNGYGATVMRYNGSAWETVGSAGFSAGGAGYTSLAFNGSTPYVAYQDYGGKATVMKFESCLGSSNSFAVSTAGTYTVTVNVNGCTASASQSVTVNAAPTAFAVTGGGVFCSGGSGVAVGLENSESGVTYQLKNGATDVGTPVDGTDSAIPFGNQTDAGIYTVVATHSSGCTAEMTNSVTVTVTTSPSATISGTTSFCAGGSSTLSVPAQSGATYCWASSTATPTWENVGSAGFSAGDAYPSIAFSGSTPYVAYQDVGNGNKATVMKYNGSAWETVGSTGFSAGDAYDIRIAFSGSTPYVAYQDGGNGNKATVMKYNGSAWETVGSAGFSAGDAGYTSLAFSGSTPYVAYQDVGNDYKATVMKYNGSAWETVGSAGFSAGDAYFTSLAFNGSTPYVAYQDYGNGGKATVMRYNGSAWETVGSAGFSAGNAGYTNLAFNGSTPYVAYQDVGNDYKATVMKYNGSAWETVGSAGFSAGEAGYTSLAFSGSTPYVAYQDVGNDYKATVMKYNGSAWETVGSAGFSAGNAYNTSLAFEGSTPYVAYQDYGNGGKATVMKFQDCLGSSNSFAVSTAGTYTVTVNINGCTASASQSVTVNAAPTVFAVTGGGAYCTGGNGVAVGLENSESGVSYQLKINDIDEGAPVTGTGNAISFGNQTAAGTYTVVATNTNGGCSTEMTNSVTVTINPPMAFAVTGGGAYCSGGSGLAVGLENSESGISYQLKINDIDEGAPVTGTGNAISFGNQTAAGTYTVVATNTNGGCSTEMTGNVVISVKPLSTEYYVTGGGLIQGGTPIAITLSNSDLNVNYQLLKDGADYGVSVAGTGNALVFSTNQVGIYTVVATSSNGCTALMSGSALVEIRYCVTSEDGLTRISLSYTPASNSYDGTNYESLYFVSWQTPSYWIFRKDYDFFYSNNSTGATPPIGQWEFDTNSGGSPLLGNTITVNEGLCPCSPPTPYNVTGGGAYCSGGAGVTVDLENSESGVSYQLKNGATDVGTPVDGTGSAISFGNQTAAGTYTVVATRTSGGCTASMTGSAVTSVIPLPTAFAVTGGGAYCSGGNGVEVGLSNSESGVSYQLKNGATNVGTPVDGTGSAIPFGNQTDAGIYTVVATHSSGCTAEMTNSVTVTVASPSATILGNTSFCTGSSTTLSVPAQSGATYCWASSTATPAWENVGSSVSDGRAGTPSLALSGGTSYVAYAENANGDKATVKKYNGTDWESVGSAISDSYAVGLSFAFSGSTPYVAYGDGANNKKTTVKKYNGTDWETVGSAGFSDNEAFITSLAFSDGTPYVAYVEYSSPDYIVMVKKYNGTDWETVGIDVVGYTDDNETLSLAFSGSTPYLAYRDAANGYIVMVKKYNGTDWETVGNEVSNANGYSPRLAFSNGTPYVAYLDSGNNYKVSVKKFNGTDWETVGSTVSDGFVNTLSLAFSSGMPYVAYMDGANGNKATVKKYNGTSWETVGSAGFSAGRVSYISLAFSGSTPYVAYRENSNNFKATVMKLGFCISNSNSLSVNAAGTYTVTVDINGCTASASQAVTVNTPPTAFAVTGGGAYCTGGNGVAVGLENSESGVSYQLKINDINEGSPVTGTGNAISFGNQTAAETYTVVATNTNGGCSTEMTNSVTVTINPPMAFAVTGGGVFCSGGSGLAVGLENSESGISYQLKINDIDEGAPVTGTGNAISFGNQTAAGTYTVVATNINGGCSTEMTNNVTVTINPPMAFAVTGGGAYCSGGSGVAVGLENSESGISYQLKINDIDEGAPVTGTGNAISFGNQTAAGTYTVVATNTNGGCSTEMTGNVVISVKPLSTEYYVTGGGLTQGGTPIAITLSNSDLNVNYQLLKDGADYGVSVAGTGNALVFSTNQVGIYTVVATSSNGCTALMSGSALVEIRYCVTSEDGLTRISLSYTPASNSYDGTNYESLYFVSWQTPSYWIFRKDYDFFYSNNSTGATPPIGQWEFDTNSGGSPLLGNTITVNEGLCPCSPPTPYNVTGGGAYCSGGAGVTVDLENSESGVTYQLKNGATDVGTPVDGTGSAISFGNQTAAGTYTVVATRTSGGCTASMTGSAVTSVIPLPTAFAVTGGGAYCSGGNGVEVGLSNSESGVSYQLKNGATDVSTPVDGTGSAISFGNQTAAATYTVVATRTSGGCTASMTGNAVTSVILLPTAFAVTGGGVFCSGGNGVEIGLSSSESGVSYQLKNGTADVGTPVDGTGSAIPFGNQTAAGTYTVVATNTNGGCTAEMTNNVTINAAPTAYAVTGGGAYCTGASGVAVGLANSESGVTYQLKNGATDVGTPVDGTGSAISFGNQTAAGTYTVVARRTTGGCTAEMTDNATISIDALPNAFAGNDVAVNCTTPSTTLTATGGVSYVWNNSATQGGSVTPATTTTYTVTVTGANGCTATDDIVVTADKTTPTLFNVSGGGTFCAGENGLAVLLSGSTNGISYQLQQDNSNLGNPVTGTGNGLNFGVQVTSGTYTVIATNTTNGCTSTMSSAAVIIKDETLPAFVTASVPANITLNCTDVIPAAVHPTATNSCSTVSMIETSTKGTDISQCSFYSYAITRTWTATDKRANTATVSQVITVQDETAPAISPLANITATENTLPNTITTSDCMAAPTITFTETTVNLTVPPCYTYAYRLQRTWRATDACNNSSTATQTITAVGIRLTCPSDKTINTNSDGVNNFNCSSLATASMGVAPAFLDGCDISVLRYVITGATTGNGNGSVAGIAFMKDVSTITYNLNHSLTDVCSFNITVKDNEAPKITLTSTVVLDACTMPNPIPEIYKPTVSDNCTGTNALEVMSDVLADVTGCSTKTAAQKYIKLLTRTWKATDENGNTATAVQKIYLRDNVPPITVCKNVTVSIGSANMTLPVSSLNNGSNDLCTAANALTFVGCMNTTTACTNFGANLTLKASMIPSGQNQTTITVRVKARDACGNETVTPVSTIITLKRIGTMENNSNNSDNSIAIQDTEANIPAEASTVPTVQGEMKCYPTPFMEDLNVQYNLTETIETVTLKLYDNQGRLVKTMEQLEQEAGFYQVRWNLSDLQSGMYHVCLELNGKCTKMERVIMMK